MFNRAIPSELRERAARHCRPILAKPMPDISFEGSATQGWGTITLVQVEDRLLGVTCYHVVEKSLKSSCPGFMIALERHTPFESVLLASSRKEDLSFPFDIAVFDGEELHRSGVVPLLLDATPSILEEGEIALAVGFPGYGRVIDGRYMTRRRYFLSPTCQGATDRHILLQGEAPDQEEDFKIAGMSGGPIFKIISAESYSLVGIIFQGRARGDAREDGGDERTFLVSGFPLSVKQLKDLLERGVL